MNKSASLEVFTWVGALTAFFFTFRKLFLGQASFIGDAFNFAFPFFSYFSESLMNGHFPYWDPFTHGGHPFYPVISHNRLLDPITLMVIGVGRFFTENLLILFNWNVLLTCVATHLGIYLLLRPLFTHWVFRISLVPILLFSTLTFSSFWHVAALFFFVWIPYILIFLNRIIFQNRRSWRDFLFLALFLGIQGQGYFAVSLIFLLLFYFLSLLLFYRQAFVAAVLERENRIKIISLVFLVLMMGAQTFVLLVEQSKFLFPIRMTMDEFMSSAPLASASTGHLSYAYLTKTGAFSSPWNFLWLIFPNWWGKPSEVFLSIGALPWFIAMIGIFFGKDSLKKIWLCLLCAFGMIILGPSGGLHPFLFYIFPPAKIVRHLMEFSYLFLLPLLYFFVLGCNVIATFPIQKGLVSISRTKLVWFLAITIYLLSGCRAAFELQFPDPRFVAVILLFTAGFVLLKKKVGPSGSFISFVSIALFTTGLLVPQKAEFFSQIGLLLLLPAISYFLLQQFGGSRRAALFGCILILSTVGASYVHVRYYEKLFTGMPVLEELGARIYRENKLPDLRRSVSPYESIKVDREAFTVPAIMRRKLSLFNHNSSESIEAGLKTRILSYYIMYKDCFRLLRSNLSPEVIGEVFSINEDIFQYKDGYILKSEAETVPYLASLKTEQFRSVLKNNVVLNEEQGTSWTKGASPVQSRKTPVRVLSYQSGDVTLKVTTDRPGFLYWSDGYDEAWEASLNGRREKILKANVGFKALKLNRGDNEIHLFYNPVLYRFALALYFGTISSIGLFLMASYSLNWRFSPNRSLRAEYLT